MTDLSSVQSVKAALVVSLILPLSSIDSAPNYKTEHFCSTVATLGMERWSLCVLLVLRLWK